MAVLDHVHALARQTGTAVPRQHRRIRIPRIAPDVDLFVEQLFAEAVAAAFLDRKLRPSSAWRASKPPSMKPISSDVAA
ncbi:hypothetical protein LP420_17485 [Massilia sp. B-10]|nr:hypothetical protein LP420_17485 [Massilia sp. B-10]